MVNNFLVKEVKRKLDNESEKKIGKYLDFVDTSTLPLFKFIASTVIQNAKDHHCCSKLISKIKDVYSTFKEKKSIMASVKIMFHSNRKKLNSDNKQLGEINVKQEDDEQYGENHIFRYIINQIEFEPSAEGSNLIEEANQNRNEINTSTNKTEINLIDENNDNSDNNKTYLSETLLANSNKITKWFVKRYFTALKDFINKAKDDNEVLETFKNTINLSEPMSIYVTFWKTTNLLFLNDKKWYQYYPALVGETIFHLSIGLVYIIPAGIYSLGTYIWRALFGEKKETEIPPGGSLGGPKMTDVQINKMNPEITRTDKNSNKPFNPFQKIQNYNREQKNNSDQHLY